MAVTAAEISAEGFRKAGVTSPTTAQMARALFWIEEIKNDIYMTGRRLRFLEQKTISVLPRGRSWIDRPTDFEADLKVTVLDSRITGICQGGTESGVTLAADEAATEGDIVGKEILVTYNTTQALPLVRSCSQAYAYNPTFKIASMIDSTLVSAQSGDIYYVIDTYYPLIQKPNFGPEQLNHPGVLGRPDWYYPMPFDGSGSGKIRFNTVPDRVYGLKLEYYANLLEVVGQVPSLYGRWRNVFVYGVYARALESNDDTRAEAEKNHYSALLSRMVAMETEGVDLNDLRQLVSDY